MQQHLFIFNNSSNPVTHGANALKLENEVVSENFNESVNEVNNQYHEELLKNQEVKILLKISEKMKSFSQEPMETSEDEDENQLILKSLVLI